MPRTPQNLKLDSYEVSLRDMSNPFGEVTSANLTVKGLTLPLVYSRQIVRLNRSFNNKRLWGYARFDQPPPGSAVDSATSDGLDRRASDCGEQIVFPMEDDEPAYLVVTACYDSYDDVEEFHVKLDKQAYMPQVYIALVVSVGERPVELGESIEDTEGLILKLISGSVAGEAGTYERIGTFQFHRPDNLRPDLWQSKTLTLI